MLVTRKWLRLTLVVISTLLLYLTFRLVKQKESVNLKALNLMSDADVKRELKWSNISLVVAPDLLACRHPELDPFDKTMAKFFKNLSPLKCSTLTNDWVEVIDGRFVVTADATKKFGDIKCRFIPFIRETDHATKEGEETDIANNTLIPYDFFRANCKSSSGTEYSNIHAGIHKDEQFHQRKNTAHKGLGLDVLIIGFDSVSRMTYNRKLPETLKYFKDVLKGTVLKGYNIVGDGTPQALIPIFTGKTEPELPRPLKRLRNGLYADLFPMAWKNFSKYGYVTSWSEDLPSIGTFTYRMTGFKEQPTDHYMRTFHLKVDDSKHQRLCIGSKPRSRVVLDWMRDFMSMYRNGSKFGFMFHSELSHDDNNLIQTTDEYLKDTLKNMNDNGLLNNTMLILMSDHGARFSSIRATLQGKQEERNPFFSFSFPPWFKSKYPKAYGNVLNNSERLVTPFDIHPTLMDVLEFKGAGVGDVKKRGISLFKEIPLHRTCKDADVEPHWCNCLQWSPMENNNIIALAAAKALVDQINKITEFKRDICAKLSLKGIVRSAIFKSSSEMLSFKQTIDEDGFKPDLSGTTHTEANLLQLTIYTSPNNGMYESTITHNIAKNTYIVKAEAISRTNKYGNDPHCIYDTEEQLRKYCYCKDNIKQ